MSEALATSSIEIEPMIRFDPSQQRFFADPARVIVVVWHRQKGKDFTAAAKAIDHAMRTGQDWFIVSLTQRQADATFDKCKRVARAFERMLNVIINAGESEYGSEQKDPESGQWFKFTARVITLPNGARIISLPGRDPDTLAGLTGNVIFTEFGLFPNGGFDHWRVVFPLTTRGFSCIVISTPRGKNTKFYELFRNLDGKYSVHFCDIDKSIAEDGFILRDNDGNPTSKENFKKLYGDDAGWIREYECQFSGDLSTLIAWAELERAGALGVNVPFTFKRIDRSIGGALNMLGLLGIAVKDWRGKRLAIGWDVARRGDLSVVTFNELLIGKPSQLIGVVAMQGVSFEAQRSVVTWGMDLKWGNVGFGDATGLGMESNEVLQKRYGERWTPFTFTGPGKREVASALKTAFSDGMQTLPDVTGQYSFVAHDLYAIQKDDSGSTLVLDETENPQLPESHCDIAYSLGLARLAGARSVKNPLPRPLMQKPVGW